MLYLCKVGGFMSDFNKKDFGENIKKFRKIKGLSQENLAMAIGKSVARPSNTLQNGLQRR